MIDEGWSYLHTMNVQTQKTIKLWVHTYNIHVKYVCI